MILKGHDEIKSLEWLECFWSWLKTTYLMFICHRSMFLAFGPKPMHSYESWTCMLTTKIYKNTYGRHNSCCELSRGEAVQRPNYIFTVTKSLEWISGCFQEKITIFCLFSQCKYTGFIIILCQLLINTYEPVPNFLSPCHHDTSASSMTPSND